MGLVTVILAVGGLVAAAEADQIDGHRPQPRPTQNRNHPPVQIRPGRLTVQQQQHLAVGVALVEVMHPQGVPVAGINLDVVGFKRVIG
jgi:hypothetical protein